MNQTIHRGAGSIHTLPDYLTDRYGQGVSILVVHGRTSYRASGVAAVLDAASGLNIVHFDGVTPNPELSTVRKGLEILKTVNPRVVVAIGGGSVIDTAKAMLAFLAGESLDEILAGRFTVAPDRPELIVAPTTAGSGSESTHFAVLYRDHVKYSLAHPGLLPDTIWLDPELLVSCPRSLALSSGADAICQCVESWWNVHATPDSRALAEEGLRVLLPSFPVRIGAPDMRTWEQRLHGANLAGQAINITKTTAGHALSYGLTTSLGLPHGFAVLAVMQFLTQRTPAPGLDSLFAASGRGPTFAEGFDRLCEDVWRCNPISDYFGTMPREGLPSLAAGVNVERLGNHPVQLTREQIQSIYLAIQERHAQKPPQRLE